MPIIDWLPQYQSAFLKWDMLAGITLAFFVLPESMAYATLAGVPSYFGIYCCIAGGLFFALFTTSKHLAIGPTSSMSLMIGSTVAVLSGGDPARWAAIASLTALVVAVLCLIAFVLRLSALVNFISDSILLGFKAGAALSIMATQIPKLFGVEGGGSNFFTRMSNLFQQLPKTNWTVLIFGLIGLAVLFLGDRLFPGKPVSLAVVIASILVITYTQLSGAGIHLAGEIPSQLPTIKRPSLRFSDVDGILDLAFACFLMGYIETISAARTFAMKNNYTINPRQELLSLGAANFASAFSSGYVVAGGLSQSTVNENSGAKSPLSLIICSVSLGLILLFLAGFLKNLPEVILAAIVIHAVSGLIKVKELKRIYTLDKVEFSIAMTAVAGVLVFGILKGVIIAVFLSLILLIRRISRPNVPILGRIGNSLLYSDITRHTDNIIIDDVTIQRVESSILYFNAQDIVDKIYRNLEFSESAPRLMILDLSAVPFVDVSGASMLLKLFQQLQERGIAIKLVGALSNVRELFRKVGVENLTGRISRSASIHEAVEEFLHPSKKV